MTNVCNTLPNNIIIPNRTLNTDYLKVLNSIDCLITLTERKMLLLLNRYCNNNGKIYPKRETLANNLKITERQITNIIRSLVEKGFLFVEPPISLEHRHLYGKGNKYHFLYHSAYDNFVEDAENILFFGPSISPQISSNKTPDTNNPTFNKFKSLRELKEKSEVPGKLAEPKNVAVEQPKAVVANTTEKQERVYNERPKERTEVVENKPTGPTTSGCNFNVTRFRKANAGKNQEAVDLAINTTLKRMKAGIRTDWPRAFAQKIVDIQSGNMNEADTAKQHIQIKQDSISNSKEDKKILHKVGVVVSSRHQVTQHLTPRQRKNRRIEFNKNIEENQKKSDEQKLQEWNAKRNELLNNF